MIPDGCAKCRVQISSLVAIGFAFFATGSEADYDKIYSYRYTEFSGYELSEDGVREAFENFDTLNIDGCIATLAVVGEQEYTSLIPQLKDIYNRSAEDSPEPNNPAIHERYTAVLFLDELKITAVKALIRCAEPEAEKFAIETAMRAPSMFGPLRSAAVQNLKYLVPEYETDVVSELAFLIRSQVGEGPEAQYLARMAVRELVEVEHYLVRANDRRAVECTRSIDALNSELPSKLQREIASRREGKPGWLYTRQLVEARTRS